ncbi:MAG TPA: carbon-nitrogen family hydrolase, partial [Acidimicrobiia bacterium]
PFAGSVGWVSASGGRVALVQADCSSDEGFDARIDRVLAETDRACEQADLVMLPELWSTAAFDLDCAREHAQPFDCDLVSRMSDIARTHSVWLHGGSFAEITDSSQHFNTSVLFGPDGSLVATYRKIHVFGYGGEAELMSAGDELVVVETPLGPTGLATCYDLRFPEQFRALTGKGAQAFLITSGWPTKRIEAWDVLVQARAIEDQAWVIACNQVGTQKGVELGGHSAVIDPMGSVVARDGAEENILHATIDPSAVAEWRAEFPALADAVDL